MLHNKAAVEQALFDIEGSILGSSDDDRTILFLSPTGAWFYGDSGNICQHLQIRTRCGIALYTMPPFGVAAAFCLISQGCFAALRTIRIMQAWGAFSRF
jgi:hypothetical protein